MEARPHKKFEGIFLINNQPATINLIPGHRVYGEQLVRIGEKEYRIWDKWRSKPSAAISKGIKEFPVKKRFKILYLGCGSGTTCSHFSDIIGKEGLIYAVDVAERPLKDLIREAEIRANIIPILADSRKPEEYEATVLEKVDLIYEDVADPDQIKILIRNAEKFLKPNGFAMIAIKSQSISSVKPPKQVYDECLKELQKHFEILDKVKLDPYEKAHLFLVMKLK
ncbi:MAG: fibrillarin-like rRNA/tRNA 2'-O-methyltransferase [Candidatus Heimdallarchaeota archaeon]